MNKIIEKTVESKYAPHDTNVSWLDVSGDKPVKKYYINGKWVEVGGSGGGSSNPTEADATKVWQVTPVQKGTKTEETVIVHEQTLVDKQELEYNDKFVPGAQCVAVVDGVEYSGEVVVNKGNYVFQEEFGVFYYKPEQEIFKFEISNGLPEVTAKLSIIEETPIYDYNWAPGVKIPVPTAEDEGKILIVTKTDGDASTIVPEQPVPADNQTPLTDVDLTKFVVGNTVKVTISANSETFTATGIIEEIFLGVSFIFNFNDAPYGIVQIDNSLYTDAISVFGPNSTIKLECIEPNYEYQLQENSGSGSSSTSDVLWPAMYEYDGNEIMATFVPEDVEHNTWCMVCGEINGGSIDTCLPVLITSYGSYVICNKTDNAIDIATYSVDGGKLLRLSSEGR